jgi:nicotinamide mononucleotide transporter
MTAINVFGQSISWLEALAFVTGLWCVWLVKRMSLWNWPVGLFNVACFAVLFLDAKLYADAVLQIAFAALSVYGWWQWSRTEARVGDLPVSRSTAREALTWFAASAAAIAAGAQLLARFTDSPVPLADTSILVMSLVATAGQALRRLESWWIWIAVDMVSVPLYWQRGLPLTALLFGLFLLLCIAGQHEWAQRWRAQGRRTAVVR